MLYFIFVREHLQTKTVVHNKVIQCIQYTIQTVQVQFFGSQCQNNATECPNN